MGLKLMTINLDILDPEQKGKLKALIDQSGEHPDKRCRLSPETIRLAHQAIDAYQHYKAAHGSLYYRCRQLEREIEALRREP